MVADEQYKYSRRVPTVNSSRVVKWLLRDLVFLRELVDSGGSTAVDLILMILF